MKIIKQEIEIDYDTKKKIEIICSFCNTTPTFYKGSIRSVELTNLNYLEPHRVIINGNMYLFFNKSDVVFYKNLNNRIKLIDLEKYIKST